MAWSGQWSIVANGHEVNSLGTGGPYSTVVPEADWEQEQTIKLAAVDGDYPAYVGLQPAEGNYTLLIQMTDCDEATYDTRIAQLKAWMPPGQWPLTLQVRGMPAAKSVNVIRRSFITNFKLRQVTVLTTARKPVLT